MPSQDRDDDQGGPELLGCLGAVLVILLAVVLRLALVGSVIR